MLRDPEARALYLFPTKALAQDQLAELHGLVGEMKVDLKTYTYDGDTPVSARQAIRQAGHIVVTNPDMLHTGVLPHHTRWVKLFANLRYVVIDELHAYRGVFGSHLANVLRRLWRVCALYDSHPVLVCRSAPPPHPYGLPQRATSSAGRNPSQLPAAVARESARPDRNDPRLPRWLPSTAAARDRAWTPRRFGAGRGQHERPGAGHRHRPPRRGRALRLSRHDRKHLATDWAGGPPARGGGGGLCG